MFEQSWGLSVGDAAIPRFTSAPSERCGGRHRRRTVLARSGCGVRASDATFAQLRGDLVLSGWSTVFPPCWAATIGRGKSFVPRMHPCKKPGDEHLAGASLVLAGPLTPASRRSSSKRSPGSKHDQHGAGWSPASVSMHPALPRPSFPHTLSFLHRQRCGVTCQTGSIDEPASLRSACERSGRWPQRRPRSSERQT